MKTYAEVKFYGNLKLALVSVIISYVTSILDYILVGNVLGEQALEAFAMTVPYLSLITFFSYLISSGTAMMIAIEVGKGSREKGNQIFSQGIVLSLIIGILLSIVFILSRNCMFASMQIPDELLPYMKDYFMYMSMVPIFQMLSELFYGVIWNAGGDKYCIWSLVIRMPVNIVGSIIFMNVMGIAGAALGTLLCLILGIVPLLVYFRSKMNVFKWQFYIKLKSTIQTFKYSAGEAANYFYLSILQFIMNTFLVQRFGGEAILIFSVIINMESLYLTVFSAPADAVIVLLNVFVGEKNNKGILKSMKVAQKTAIIEGLIVMVTLFIFARYIPTFFGIKLAGNIANTVIAIRIFSVLSVVFPFIMLFSTYYLSIDHVIFSLRTMLMQVVIMPVVCSMLLSLLIGINGVWIGFVVGSMIMFLTDIIYIRIRFKNKSFPYLLDLESMERQLSYDVPVSKEGVMSLVDMVECDLKEREIDNKKIYKIMLMIEETEMLVVEKNVTEDAIIQCDLFLDDSIRLVLRDTGEHNDATNQDASVHTFRAYTAAMLVGTGKDNKYIKTCGDNRTLFEF